MISSALSIISFLLMLYWRRSDNGSAIFFTHSRSVRTRPQGPLFFQYYPLFPLQTRGMRSGLTFFHVVRPPLQTSMCPLCVFLLIRSLQILRSAAYAFAVLCSLNVNSLVILGLQVFYRSALHFCVVLPMFLRLVLFILYFLAKNQRDTWNLALSRYVLILLVLGLNVRALKQSKRVFFCRASLFVAPLTQVKLTDEPQEWRVCGYKSALFWVLLVSY